MNQTTDFEPPMDEINWLAKIKQEPDDSEYAIVVNHDPDECEQDILVKQEPDYSEQDPNCIEQDPEYSDQEPDDSYRNFSANTEDNFLETIKHPFIGYVQKSFQNVQQAWHEEIYEQVDDQNSSNKQMHGKWFIDCTRCSTTIKWSQRKNHIRKHLAEDNKPKLYICLLCNHYNRPNESNYLEHMHFHVRKIHKVKRAIMFEHFTKNANFDEIVNEALSTCFRGSIKVFKPATSSSCVPKLSLVKCQTAQKPSSSYMVKSLAAVNAVNNDFLNDHESSTWRYRCLFCMGAVVFETMFFSSIKKHLVDKHQISEPVDGKNYMDVTTISSAKHYGQPIVVPRHGRLDFRKNKIVRKYRKQAQSTITSQKYLKKATLAQSSKPANLAFQKCKECQKKFRNQLINLKMHCKYHLREKGYFDYLYQCLICKNHMKDSTYMQEAHVRSHLKIHHKIAYPLSSEHFTNDTELYRDLITEETKKNFDFRLIQNSRKPAAQNWKNSVEPKSEEFVVLPSSTKHHHASSSNRYSTQGTKKYHLASSSKKYTAASSRSSKRHFGQSSSRSSKVSIDDGFESSDTDAHSSTFPEFQRCKECHKSFRNQLTNLRTHCRYHLRERGLFDYLYECLECRKENRVSTYMQEAHVRSHLKSYHQIAYPQNDEHFTNETEKFRDIITEETKKNFDYYIGLRSKKGNRIMTGEKRKQLTNQLSVSRELKAQYASIRKICETIIPLPHPIKVELQS